MSSLSSGRSAGVGWAALFVVASAAALPGCPAPAAGCARNSDCPRGSFCSAGACMTVCTPETEAADCDPGQRCNTFGMCVGGALDGGLDGGVLDAGAPVDAPRTSDAPLAMDAELDASSGDDTGPGDSGLDAATPDDTGLDAAASGDAGADAPATDAPLPPLTGTLVINEIDYDQPSTDTAEFVEIYNGGATVADLSQLAVVLVNGNNNLEYARVMLSGTLAPGAYLVVGVAGQALSIPGGVTRVDLGMSIQNGPPDGVVLWDTSRLVALDALSYEGAITAATIDATTVSLVEGTASTLAESNTTPDSLCRLPNGRDTNDAASDWMLCTTPTPGGPNS